jgi:hypothetical protein
MANYPRSTPYLAATPMWKVCFNLHKLLSAPNLHLLRVFGFDKKNLFTSRSFTTTRDSPL